MGAHPQVYAHPPYHLGRDLIMNLHRTLGDSPGEGALTVLRDHATAKLRRFLDDATAERLATWLDAQTAPSPGDVARFIWTELPDDAEGKHAFIKENNIHRMLAFLINTFPDAKFVYQVRDPRDFLVSALKRRVGPLGNKFGSVREAVNVWREDNLGGLNAYTLLGPEKVHLVRYEDLISAPEPVLRGLCDFAGLPFAPEMLDFHKSERASQIAVKGGPRENVAKPLMAGNSRKYLKSLSKSQIRTVEAYCGDLMRVLGYNPEYGTGLLRSPWRAIWPMLCEPLERIRNRQLKPQYKVGHSRLTKALNTDIQPMLPWVYGEKDER